MTDLPRRLPAVIDAATFTTEITNHNKILMCNSRLQGWNRNCKIINMYMDWLFVLLPYRCPWLLYPIVTSTIQPSAVVRDLGFLLDSELCMKQHVAKVAAACFYRLRRLRQIRRRVEEEVTTRLVIALVISRLGYCNSLLAWLPLCTIKPLQRVQNAAARLIFELSLSEHITPNPLQLHWLPIRWRVQFKLCCFMHAVVTGRCPPYLGSIVQPATQSRSGLRPSSSEFSVPRTRTKVEVYPWSHDINWPK